MLDYDITTSIGTECIVGLLARSWTSH